MKKNRIILIAFTASISVFLASVAGCKKQPPTIEQLSASLSGSDAVELGWTYTVHGGGIEECKIYWSDYDGGYQCIDHVSGSNYYIHRNPTKNHYNYYKVSIENDYGMTMSDVAKILVGENSGGGGEEPSSLSAPTSVNAEKEGSRVCVSWNSVSGASYYKVYRCSSSSGSYDLLSGNVNITYYYDNSPLSDNYYKVKAVNGSGTESDYSSYAYCQYSGGGGGGGNVSVPNAPTGVTAENWGNSYIPEIHISWNSVDKATNYKVYRSTSANGTYSLLGETTYTYYSDFSPKNGQNYYKVKAFNSAGGSNYSSYAMYNHDPSSQQSPCPVHYTSHTATSTTIYLNWTIPTTSGCGTPTKAYLRVKNPTSSNYADLQTLSGTATSASFSYPGWADTEGYVYCGIITENASGSSGGVPLVYNWKTNTWYGGNGKSINELHLNEEILNFEK